MSCPQRLPGAIRTASLWLGKLRRGFNTIRAEIEREINADEIKQDLHNQAIMESLQQAEKDLRDSLEVPDDTSTPSTSTEKKPADPPLS